MGTPSLPCAVSGYPRAIHLNAFGGAPKQWVYDNPKTVWVQRSVGRQVLHSYLRQLVADLNVLVEPCTPRMAWQKGSVENLVGFVKKNFFLAYAFADRADILAQLPQWLHRVNHERPSDATGKIPAKRLEAVDRSDADDVGGTDGIRIHQSAPSTPKRGSPP